MKEKAIMQEREHTLEELRKLNRVRETLLEEGVIDYDGFKSMIDDENN